MEHKARSTIMIPTERLSRFLSFLLRHRPEDYPLDFDERGFVPVAQLLELVQSRFPDAEEADLLNLVEDADKMRFELENGLVRATYGHSFPVDLEHKRVSPPSYLYHGTARDLAENLLHTGLKPRDRQYVHLSQSAEEAFSVGKRRDPDPAVLIIDAEAAGAQGVHFYQSGPLFLSSEIPAKCLSIWEHPQA